MEFAMRIVIIGGSGHVGTYLVPRLVEAGHEVINVSRGKHNPYQANAVWEHVRQVTIDREKEDAAGTFGKRIAELKPDAVIDMICFTPESAKQITEALRGRIQHYLFCGTIWIHGHSVRIPTTEEQPREPFGDYGVMKAACETYLLKEARVNGFPATLLHPGHIVGPGWVPLNPAGHFTPEVFASLAKGEALTLSNLGMETVHHVHADDVAQIFMKAMARRSCALGESFHVVSPQALTLRGYAESVASWFGLKADLRFLLWEDWRKTVSKDEATCAWDHIAHSPNCSIEKARKLLGYEPRYTSLEAVREAVKWLIDNGVITI
jgi:nucleoside-diphosphate-sugar epimerase